LFYLAVAPSFIATVTGLLAQADLLHEDGSCYRRVIIEKPFGHDLESAKALSLELQKSLREDQIYRIDHFAGKDAVQDLAVFRLSNGIIEQLWNRTTIDNVQITVAESVGVEGRAAFYEQSGALRDMVPNHLAEVLSLVAMEPPVSLTAEHMRDKQVELLESVRHIKPEEVGQFAVRGQYGRGTIQGKPVPSYREEPGVNPHSNTETYVALHVQIDNWRWAGVPFLLRTGKRCAEAFTEVVITFREPPAKLFPSSDGRKSPNQLIFEMKPGQAITMLFGAKVPGLKTQVENVAMRFEFKTGSFGPHVTGYERLLHDAMAGEAMLFQRAEFVEQGWRLVQPLLDAWNAPPTEPFPNYAAGSNGPTAADALLAALGLEWHKPGLE
jgi:glucose-6-phosphate 1-dehydrogenase